MTFGNALDLSKMSIGKHPIFFFFFEKKRKLDSSQMPAEEFL